MRDLWSWCRNDVACRVTIRAVGVAAAVALASGFALIVDCLVRGHTLGWNAAFAIILVLMLLKLAAILFALSWIPTNAVRFIRLMNRYAKSITCYECRRFKALKKAGNCSPPFGIMDSLVYDCCHRLSHRSRFWENAVPMIQELLSVWFGVANMCYATGALLIIAAYCGAAACIPLRLAVALSCLFSLTAMAVEIIVGLALLGDDYARHLHGRGHPVAASPVLRQLSLLCDLIGAVVIAGGATCLTWAVTVQDAFGGDGVGCVYETAGAEVLSAALRCLSFIVTTLLTVGYGDIWPSNVGCRLMVMVVQVLGLLLLLLIIQLALGLKSEGFPVRADKTRSPRDDRASGWLTPIASFLVVCGLGIGIICLSLKV